MPASTPAIQLATALATARVCTMRATARACTALATVPATALATVPAFVIVHATAHVTVLAYPEDSDNRFSSACYSNPAQRVNTLGCLSRFFFGCNECGREICEDMR